jgi:4-aminobutyrate aminotransferase/(S)-3-amino-2-methylpropionate transaminase
MASVLRTAGRVRPAFRCLNAPRIAPVALRRQYASAAAAAAVPEFSGEQSFFPDEPTAPIVRTQIPGPQSKSAIERLSKVFDTRSLNMMADYSQSYGN